MNAMCGNRKSTLTRLVAWSLVAWMILAGASQAQTQGVVVDGETSTVAEPDAAPADNFFMRIVKNLFDSKGLLETLGDKNFTLFAFIALNVIVFVETGLLIGFFLPGDSLLVTAGVVCSGADWNLPLLLGTLCASAIIGDSVGYTIGLKAGPKIFNREKSWLFKKDHLVKAQAFYEKHGGKTIVLARFMPIIRTFAPVVAGAGKMHYRSFLFFNVIGGIAWVFSMVLCGYYLVAVANDALKPVFGPDFDVKNHIEKVVIIVVFLSIAPGIYVWLRSRFSKKTIQGQQSLAA